MLVFVVFFVTLAGAFLPPFALNEIAYVYFVAAMAGAAAENKVARRMMESISEKIRCCFFISFVSSSETNFYYRLYHSCTEVWESDTMIVVFHEEDTP